MRHLVRIGRLRFSPDPKNYVLGSIGWEGIVKLWNPETGELIRRLE
jgi:WD40 repeat protein